VEESNHRAGAGELLRIKLGKELVLSVFRELKKLDDVASRARPMLVRGPLVRWMAGFLHRSLTLKFVV
jgi:hypothetical protein